jgi:hypothetical protein
MKPLSLCLVSLSFALSFAWACQRPPPAPFGRVLEHGGELGDVAAEDTTPRITQQGVTVWGVIEVPDGSRLQASYAAADAIARAELLKLVRVRVAGVMVSVDSTDPARQEAYEHTMEAVDGSLRTAGDIQHGYQRVLRGGELILRVWSRLSVPRAEVEAAFVSAGQPELPQAFLEELAQ